MPDTIASPRSGPTVLIAGGGTGGLTLALCLHRLGIPCQVFEAASEIRPLGVGINILPHSSRVLTVLGLAPGLGASGIETRELAYYTRHGQRIWAEARGRHAGYRWPQYSIHRGELQLLLLQAVRDRLGVDAVREGHRLVSFEEREGQVDATFAGRDGEVVGMARGDILVGADGIHSAARATFYPDEREPKFSGRLLWRSVTRAAPFLSGESMIMAGFSSQKFVAYPISATARAEGASLINWVAELTIGGDEEPSRDWNREVDRERFAPAFASWQFDWLDVPRLIAESGPVYEFPMSDRDPVARWSFGRTTLLGDAAHPMYPIGSNGASQAILDAASLAQAIADVDDVEAALQRYERERLAPTSKIVLANRQQGPELVMQMVEDRAPEGFERLDDVISPAELEEVSSRYKQVAGFDLDALNAKGETSLV